MFGWPNGRRDETSRDSSSSGGFSPDELLGMADGGMKLVDCIRDSHVHGTNLAIETYGSTDFVEWEHYPSDHVRDPKPNAHCYFHVHPPDNRHASDSEQFHLPWGPGSASGRRLETTESSAPGG